MPESVTRDTKGKQLKVQLTVRLNGLTTNRTTSFRIA